MNIAGPGASGLAVSRTSGTNNRLFKVTTGAFSWQANDGVAEEVENCRHIANAGQADGNANGLGDLDNTAAEAPADGCSCSSAGSSLDLSWLLSAPAMLALVRRRRNGR